MKTKQSKRILIVDDNDRITDMFARVLGAHGYKTLVANSVSDANEIMKRNEIALVLLDIKMPEIQGDVLYEIVRMFHQRSKILVSSLYSVREQQQIIPHAHGYFDKTQGIDLLLAKVEEVLHDARAD